MTLTARKQSLQIAKLSQGDSFSLKSRLANGSFVVTCRIRRQKFDTIIAKNNRSEVMLVRTKGQWRIHRTMESCAVASCTKI